MEKITKEHIEKAIKYVNDNNPPKQESERKVVLWGCADGLAYQNLIELFKKEAIKHCGIPPHIDKNSSLLKGNSTETTVRVDQSHGQSLEGDPPHAH